MNQTIKAQWLAALRSGEYTQGMGELRHIDRFCCLGVLCDLHAKAGLGSWAKGDVYDGQCGILPPSVYAWANVLDSPTIGDDIPLSDYNDGVNGCDQHTFAQIADLIEEYL